MPISATSNHSEQHWGEVQTLIHRAIRNAGFDPVNVWENEVVDRISERIVGNIFSHDIAVADISDLNPNVMLELGLRLSSKKPTVVVVDSIGSIPFDIRDFNAVIYPSDLTIISMESFIEKLSSVLKQKHAAFSAGNYTPFLGKVVVDVIEPETRSVPKDDLIISLLEELRSRISRIERGSDLQSTHQRSDRVQSRNPDRISVSIRDSSEDTARSLAKFLMSINGIDCIDIIEKDGRYNVIFLVRDGYTGSTASLIEARIAIFARDRNLPIDSLGVSLA